MAAKDIVRFLNTDCKVHYDMYANRRIAIQLFCCDDGSPMLTATVNLTEHDISDDFVAIKDYSENEGILEVLVEAGIISRPVTYIPSGYVSIPVCRLLVGTALES